MQLAQPCKRSNLALPLAGISTIRELKDNPINVRDTGRLNKLYVESLRENPDWAKDQRQATKKLRQNVTSKEATDSSCRDTTPAVLHRVQIRIIQKKPDTGPGLCKGIRYLLMRGLVLYSMGNTYLHRLALSRQRAYHKLHWFPPEPDNAKALAAIASVLLIYRGPTVQGSGNSLLLIQSQAKASKSMNCHIASHDSNRDKTRIKCVFKCPNGKTEAEVIPKGSSCPLHQRSPIAGGSSNAHHSC